MSKNLTNSINLINSEIRTPILFEGKVVDKNTLDAIDNLNSSALVRAGHFIILNKPIRNDSTHNEKKRRIMWELADLFMKTTQPKYAGKIRDAFVELYILNTGFEGVNADLPTVTTVDLEFLKSSLMGNLKRKDNECYIIPTSTSITFTRFEKSVDLLTFCLATGLTTNFFSSAYVTARDAEVARVNAIQAKRAEKEAKAKAKKDKETAEKLEALKGKETAEATDTTTDSTTTEQA